MKNRNLLKGLFLIAISLAFGLGSINYPFGSLSRAGPGLFPLLVSGIVFLLGAAAVVRALVVEPIPMSFNVKNIALILASLSGFALISEYLNMIVGIVFMVFCAGFAGTSVFGHAQPQDRGRPHRRRVRLPEAARPQPAALLMDVLHNLAFGFEHALTLQNLMFCAIGCVVGHAGRAAARAWGRSPPSACCCR